MGLTPEGTVKKQVRRFLQRRDAYIFMPVQMGMGAATLDFLACVPIIITPDMVGRRIGAFVSVETKAAGKKATKRQELIALTMARAGAVTVLAYSANDVERRLAEVGYK